MEKRLFLCLLFLFPMLAFAQSPQSDSLFAKGVELYYKGDYRNAANCFLQTDKMDKLVLDTLSERAQYSKMWLASCYYKMGNIVEAKKYNDISYNSPPIDRKYTKQIDSLSDLARAPFEAGNFEEALRIANEISRLERSFCDKDNFFNVGTYRLKCNCFYALKQTDSVVHYLNEIHRIESLYFEYDNVYNLPTLNDLFFIEIQSGNLTKAKEISARFEDIVNSGLEEGHYYHVQSLYFKLLLSLYQRNWDDAHNMLPEYISLIKQYFVDNEKAITMSLVTVRSNFEAGGRFDDVALINTELNSILENGYEKLDALFYDYFLAVQAKDVRVDAIEKDIEIVLRGLVSEKALEGDAVYRLFKIFRLYSEGSYDLGNRHFSRFEKDSAVKYLHNQNYLGIYHLVRMAYRTAEMEIEGAIDDYYKALEYLKDDNPVMRAQIACLHVFAEKYKEARAITDEVVEYYKENVIEKKNVFKLDVDTLRISEITNIVQNYMSRAAALHDSVYFCLREMKCDYLLLKSQMLKNLDGYQIDYDYFESIVGYVVELVKTKKFIEAQEVMDNFLDECRLYYESINEDTADDSAKLDRLIGMMLYSEALQIRILCYEKGDTNGIQAHLDYLENLRYEYSHVENIEHVDVYIDAMIGFYEFTDDINGLLEFACRNIDVLDIGQLIKIADLSGKCYDEKCLSVHKKLLAKLLESRPFDHMYQIGSSISEICSYYTSNKDTVALMQFYSNELWPSFDKCGDKYIDLFISSLNELKYDIDSDMFIPYVEWELMRRSDLFIKDPLLKASAYGAIANIIEPFDYDLALEYIGQSCNFSKSDPVQELLFSLERYKILYEKSGGQYSSDLGDDQIAGIIEYGNKLVKRFIRHNKLAASDDLAELLKDQAYLMQKTGDYKGVISCCEEYLKRFDENRYIVKLLYNANSALNGSQTPMYAGKMIDWEYKSLQTFMSINSFSSNMCDDLISKTSKYAYKYQTDSLKMRAYDAALYGKGLLLRSDKSVRALIKKSGHKSVLRKFDEYLHISKLLENAPTTQIDSLINRHKMLEEQLYDNSLMFGDYKNSLKASWKDVAAQLGNGDIAIEFTYVKKDYDEKYILKDTTILEGYYGIILKKGMRAPDIVYFACADSVSFTPFMPYLDGVENIYFSPVGELNRLPLESYADYNMYRLSSTRELVPGIAKFAGQGSAIYGGLYYDAGIEELVEDAAKYKERKMASNYVGYLKGTLDEAVNIVNTINSCSDSLFHAVPYLGTDGTEASFKALSGKGKRVVHIATHGFYYTGKEAEESGLVLYTDKQRSLDNDDLAMLRSGLFMAGANNVFYGETLPAGVDDGILTAHEIANVDLSGADLVVLSACETALGEITGDGVFGLQRGFKKAGANSILMSLWKVDDAATCFLMTEFYRHWIGGESKHRALQLAKDAVRAQKEKGWDNPKYWAAFILLDGLDNTNN